MTTQSQAPPTPSGKSPEEAAAWILSSWIRLEALAILGERVTSPTEIARLIGIDDVATVNHHVKTLAKYECVELVDEVRRGGAIAHLYRAVRRPEFSDEEWQAFSETEKRDNASVILRHLFSEALASVQTGALIADPAPYLWWRAAPYDEQGREDAAREQREHIRRLQRIEEESATRIAEAGKPLGAAATVVGVLGFPRSRPGRPALRVAPAE